jgi:hypothetical protein
LTRIRQIDLDIDIEILGEHSTLGVDIHIQFRTYFSYYANVLSCCPNKRTKKIVVKVQNHQVLRLLKQKNKKIFSLELISLIYGRFIIVVQKINAL